MLVHGKKNKQKIKRIKSVMANYVSRFLFSHAKPCLFAHPQGVYS